MAKIVERTEEDRISSIDSIVKNRFSWKWLEKSVAVKDTKVLLGEFVRKIDQPGKALCTWCNDIINYGSHLDRQLVGSGQQKWQISIIV